MSVFFGYDVYQIKNQKHTQEQTAIEKQWMVWVIRKPTFYLLRSKIKIFRKPIL